MDTALKGNLDTEIQNKKISKKHFKWKERKTMSWITIFAQTSIKNGSCIGWKLPVNFLSFFLQCSQKKKKKIHLNDHQVIIYKYIFAFIAH